MYVEGVRVLVRLKRRGYDEFRLFLALTKVGVCECF